MCSALTRPFLSERSWLAIVQSLHLSEREAQVARLILTDDNTEGAIAVRLAISPHTVHTHLERLYRKLRVTSRCQVVTRMFQQYVELADQSETAALRVRSATSDEKWRSALRARRDPRALR